ncbi:hypothetical protein KXV85_003842, partial [Aspergillus fumigatus]
MGRRRQVSFALLRCVLRLVARHRVRRFRRLQDHIRDGAAGAQMGRRIGRPRPVQRGRTDGHGTPARRGSPGLRARPALLGDRLQCARLDRPARRNKGRGHCRRRVMDHDRQSAPRLGAGRLLSCLGVTTANGADRRCLPVRSYGKEGSAPPPGPRQSVRAGAEAAPAASIDLRQLRLRIREGE